MINFFLILLVVMLHSENVWNRFRTFRPARWNVFIQDFFSGGVCFIAVPLFFCISGFLFFEKEMKGPDFRKRIIKRIRTLLVPYLLVSLIAIILFLVLQSVPFLQKYFNNQLQTDLPSLLKTWLVTPLAYQLWFLRNLFIGALISPLIYLLLKQFRHFAILIMALAWFLIDELFLHNIILCLLFFSFGGYLRMFRFEKINGEPERKFNAGLWLLLWAGLIILAMKVRLPFFTYSLANVSICVGIFTVWRLFDSSRVVGLFERKPVGLLLPLTFFIFLFHEPILTIIIKLMFSFGGAKDTVSISAYIVAPVVAIGICVVAGWFLRKYIPPVYRLITGNR